MQTVIERIDKATAGLDAPIAVLDRETLRANAADLVRRASGVPIRVASKSVRCRGVLEEVLGTGLTAQDGFRGIMAYSLREAVWLVRCGARDVLLGYPTLDAGALRGLTADGVARDSITLMIDDVAQLSAIRAAIGTDRVHPRVCIDVDASLRIGPIHVGARRSPIRTPDQAATLAREALARGFDVVGVMTYEAQIAGLPDSSPAVVLMKRASARELARRRGLVVEAVRDAVGSLEIVNSGGTGSIEVSVADRAVTEVTAGSGLYVPTLFDKYRSFEPHPSLYFASVALRKPTPSIATVFAGGYIASGPAGKSRVPVPVWPKGLSLLRSEGAGEVQTPVSGAGSVQIGDRVWFRHAKAGELCERFTELHVVEADGSCSSIPTYRGEGQCFG
ncbi:amino acid deaminase/aldolase [Antrihabitans cavernicola]|uniref:Amino acid deaminase/aldolase n=1 Tax=Antrihabitans cavernicola TaxID=2495913 RepID=A0A5A7S8Q7_9NOCA|nr:amino acid deaminase/aldolase [Spelaeibacter cavernicola]KAA0022520.1 amino acid deaminase/aldolase [Spelaeibacter cavernicola]